MAKNNIKKCFSNSLVGGLTGGGIFGRGTFLRDREIIDFENPPRYRGGTKKSVLYTVVGKKFRNYILFSQKFSQAAGFKIVYRYGTMQCMQLLLTKNISFFMNAYGKN